MISTKTGFGSDTVRISFFKNRVGSDSKNPLSDHLWKAEGRDAQQGRPSGCIKEWASWLHIKAGQRATQKGVPASSRKEQPALFCSPLFCVALRGGQKAEIGVCMFS